MNLPNVWSNPISDYSGNSLRNEAVKLFRIHQLPNNSTAWQKYAPELRAEIWKNLATPPPDHNLPLDMHETGSVQMAGYSVKNIYYQSRPGFYVTGNLFVPDNGKCLLPAVIVMHGHWPQGRLATRVQARGHSLARNGYVCLTVDAFGSGERSSQHGNFEYHGANIGSSLLNVGESLMGIQVVDNMRGVDLLCSLPYVDADRIGATGASGGGNQTMWLTALDERIKAAMPVVSVGTFESYVTARNCICELLPNGLTFTEESGILALTAPRALKLCNCLGDSNITFHPTEMLRSYFEARKIYQTYGADAKLAYQIFNLPHGYWPEIREAMLGWFDLHLQDKGYGAPKAELPFETLPETELMVFAKSQRPSEVMSIQELCNRQGKQLRQRLLNTDSFNKKQKKQELKKVLKAEQLLIGKIHEHPTATQDGVTWRKLTLETSSGNLIPLLILEPRQGSDYTILVDPAGKTNLESSQIIQALLDQKCGIIIPDLSLIGENGLNIHPYAKAVYHDEARALMWLGKTMLGEWSSEINLIVEYTKTQLNSMSITVTGIKEAALAALFSSVIGAGIDTIELYDLPLSYIYGDNHTELSMAVHLPNIMLWGDVSLAIALTDAKVIINNGIMLDGSKTNLNEFTTEVKTLKQKINAD